MLKPLRNQVVLKKYEEENKTNSGIILSVENKKSWELLQAISL